MVTGHTHQCRTFEHEDRFFIDPGSVTGAFSPIQRLAIADDINK